MERRMARRTTAVDVKVCMIDALELNLIKYNKLKLILSDGMGN
jgi:hypothetical protein